MVKFILFLLTLAIVAASIAEHRGASATAADDEGDLAQRQKDMKEFILVFSNPVLAAAAVSAANTETTHRLALFVKREIGPLGAIVVAIREMPENSAADVRAKDEASDAAIELLFSHFRFLLAPHGSGKTDDLCSS